MSMVFENNYKIQAAQAKQRFLTYDQQAIIRKLGLVSDDGWLYTRLLSTPYRLSRSTGDLEKQQNGHWLPTEDFREIMTLLDLVCDSREDRFLTHRWKNMRDFGNQFHRSLLEEGRDPWAQAFQDDLEGFRRACQSLGGTPFPQGDGAYAIELFDDLSVVVQLWLGDDEFPPNLRFLWDENALQYLKYETMYFAKDLLLETLKQKMAQKKPLPMGEVARRKA